MDNKSAIWIAGAILVVGVAYIVFVGRPSVVAAECTLPNGGINKYCLEAGGRLEWDKKRAEEYEATRAQRQIQQTEPAQVIYQMTGPDGRVYEMKAGDDVPVDTVRAELRRRIATGLDMEPTAPAQVDPVPE